MSHTTAGKAAARKRDRKRLRRLANTGLTERASYRMLAHKEKYGR